MVTERPAASHYLSQTRLICTPSCDVLLCNSLGEIPSILAEHTLSVTVHLCSMLACLLGKSFTIITPIYVNFEVSHAK